MTGKVNWALTISITLAFIILAAWVGLGGSFDRFGPARYEACAVASLRVLYRANAAYAHDQLDRGYAGNMAELVRYSGGSGVEIPGCAIDSLLARVENNGYKFTYQPRNSSRTDGRWDAYEITADPLRSGRTGRRHFFVDETGVIRWSYNGTANPTSAPLE